MNSSVGLTDWIGIDTVDDFLDNERVIFLTCTLGDLASRLLTATTLRVAAWSGLCE